MSLMDKAKGILNTDKGEEISDHILDKASELAKGALGEDKSAKIDEVRDSIDKKIGTDGV
ncbi:antitoxin protein [Corynebacterium mustelae]|uniref:Antitoxin protein n=1 Tax=Corynebacterium mustelae TaxID=571915 RepID=A0A0G3GZC6_9CORY|nr:antitoxin [Corynebacterium mustelae]AKK05880.1 antitoxin protein [Corynebacterium mustelae]